MHSCLHRKYFFKVILFFIFQKKPSKNFSTGQSKMFRYFLKRWYEIMFTLSVLNHSVTIKQRSSNVSVMFQPSCTPQKVYHSVTIKQRSSNVSVMFQPSCTPQKVYHSVTIKQRSSNVSVMFQPSCTPQKVYHSVTIKQRSSNKWSLYLCNIIITSEYKSQTLKIWKSKVNICFLDKPYIILLNNWLTS